MTREVIIRQAGPQITVQDLGRPGYLAEGLSRGGAADRLAIAEGAALLAQPVSYAALELAGYGGQFEATAPLRIALTGAPMPARIDGRAAAWNASHLLLPGEVLTLGAAQHGSYGYLSVAGGIATSPFLGSRAAHLVAGLGERLADGQRLPVGPDPNPDVPSCHIPAPERFAGGVARIVPGAQTEFFDVGMRERFAETRFVRDPRGNRQGVRLAFDGAPFEAAGQRTILSEVIIPGDIQMTGDGAPYVLLPECQTAGGYPRIGSVLPEDLPLVAQAAPGTELRFRFLTLDEARDAHRDESDLFHEVAKAVTPLIRDPRDIGDLLGYQLVSGVTVGEDIDDREGKE